MKEPKRLSMTTPPFDRSVRLPRRPYSTKDFRKWQEKTEVKQ
nr:MAG TPA: hypothetical protein [Caudoviricetes sp.]